MARLCHGRWIKVMDVIREGIGWQNFVIVEGLS